MILLDVNVVLAAHRDDHPHFGRVRPWLDGVLDGDEPFTVPATVWASFVRIATHRRVFSIPTPAVDAFAFIASIRAQPHHLDLAPSAGLYETFERLCLSFDATGDLAADAFIAALAVEHGCTLASLDRDFARFEDLTWVRPG